MKKGSKHKKSVREKISDSMKGSNNAEKWFEPLVIEILEEMIEVLQQENEVWVKGKKGVKSDLEDKQEHTVSDEYIKRKRHLKKTLLVEFKIWNADWFSDMKDKFSENKTISRLLKVIDMICEINTYEDAANNATNVAVAKMHLSHHYGWKDTSNLNVNDNRSKSDEQLDKELEEYEKRNKK